MNIKLCLLIILIPIILVNNKLSDNIINKHNDLNIKSKASEHSKPLPKPSPKASTKPREVKYNSLFPKSGIPVLMYHSISYSPKNSLCVSEKQFKEEVLWLKSNNYHTITIDEFCNSFLNNELLPVKPVLLTFDDGYLDNYDNAIPVLKQNNFNATFFIITNYIGSDRFDWNQLKEMITQGNSIGSHSVNHFNMSSLSEIRQDSEIKESKRILEENLGIKIKAFCFPSGRYNITTLNLLKNAGYYVAFTTHQGRVYLGDNQYLLKRVRIYGGMSLATFISLLS